MPPTPYLTVRAPSATVPAVNVTRYGAAHNQRTRRKKSETGSPQSSHIFPGHVACASVTAERLHRGAQLRLRGWRSGRILEQVRAEPPPATRGGGGGEEAPSRSHSRLGGLSPGCPAACSRAALTGSAIALLSRPPRRALCAAGPPTRHRYPPVRG